MFVISHVFSHYALTLQLLKKKSAFVMYMLDKKLGADTFRNMLSKLVTPPTNEGESLEMNISTKYFHNLLKKTTG